MPLHVADLTAGDRVVLNCPKSRGLAKREAQFKGVFKTLHEALREYDGALVLAGSEREALLNLDGAVAAFVLQTGDPATFKYPSGETLEVPFAGTSELTLTLRIKPDGSLHDETGMRVFIERRMRMGQG
jgi:hypothetical protein